MSARMLQTTLSVYFEAKRLMFQRIPAFRLLDVGPLKCFHDHPGWPEVDAFYAADVDSAEVVAAVHQYMPDPRHMITVFTSEPESEREAYEALGYRAIGQGQQFMSRALRAYEIVTHSSVLRVETQEQMAFINRPSVYMDESQLNDGVFRCYYLEQDGLPVCRGRSVTTSRAALYVAGLDTLPDYRRRGLAGRVMRRMHSDAAERGNNLSVLCSSPSGLGLYLKLGYESLATMQAFVPIE